MHKEAEGDMKVGEEREDRVDQTTRLTRRMMLFLKNKISQVRREETPTQVEEPKSLQEVMVLHPKISFFQPVLSTNQHLQCSPAVSKDLQLRVKNQLEKELVQLR